MNLLTTTKYPTHGRKSTSYLIPTSEIIKKVHLIGRTLSYLPTSHRASLTLSTACNKGSFKNPSQNVAKNLVCTGTNS